MWFVNTVHTLVQFLLLYCLLMLADDTAAAAAVLIALAWLQLCGLPLLPCCGTAAG
jgi:hypothetical protein